MKTYWDHTESERGRLTCEQVEGMLKFERMKEGIVVPPHPGEPPVLIAPAVERVEVFGVQIGDSRRERALWFRDREDAESVLAMSLVNVDHDAKLGADFPYLVDAEAKLLTKHACRNKDLDGLRDEAASRVAMLEAHKQRVADHNDAWGKSRDVCAAVWEDWNEQRDKAAKHARIRQTFEQYQADCEGDDNIAGRFLLKAFQPSEILAAFEYEGWDLPDAVSEKVAELATA